MADSEGFPKDTLRHLVATIAYRGTKTIRGAPDTFSTFRISPGTRTPLEILSHIGDLLDWTRTMVEGSPTWSCYQPESWTREVGRFYENLLRLDCALTAVAGLRHPPQRLVQGPLADALTHVGQLAMLRRAAGSPLRGENYFKAEITAGRVGPEQEKPKLEFD